MKEEAKALDEPMMAPEAVSEQASQEILEKFDRESRTRTFQFAPLAMALTVIAILVSLYHMWTAYFGTPPALEHRAIHVAMMLLLVFALYPPFKSATRKKIPWYDYILIAAAASTAIYIIVSYQGITERAGVPITSDIVFGAILILLILEASRRVSGYALPLLALISLVYAVIGRSLSGTFRHRGYSIEDTVNFLYTTTRGIFGTAVSVSSSYIFLFVLFGAVLAKSGMGQFFNDIALAIAGGTRGGPAKVSVLASGFLGSINGSAIANVVTTGAFTIPLMKKVGYNKTFAGAVESSASVGGQILPPVMGASAFIMAETLGVPYATIAIAALIPAILYYLGIIIQVHLRATKLGLKGISRENLPAVRAVLKEQGHLIIPLVFLLYMLFFSGRTILFSALLTIIVTIVVAEFRKSTRMSVKDIFLSLADGAKTAASVAISCAAVGIIVGVVTMTGFGVKLANTIVLIGQGNLLLSLFLTMLASIVLGMGLPSIPTYIITATMAAPALGVLGVPPLVAHMFVFYFGIFANITPPVALASFAAAGLSGASPMKTGFQSMRLSAAGYIIPYIFVYNNAMLLQDVSFGDGLLVVVSGLLGVIFLAVAVEGQLFVQVPMVLRVVFFAAALLLMVPGWITDVAGLVAIILLVAIMAGIAKKKEGHVSWRMI